MLTQNAGEWLLNSGPGGTPYYSENDLDLDILALRSITTFLSLIPGPTTYSTPWWKRESTWKSGNDEKTLEVLDALATLIVRQYETVAVTAEVSETGLQVLTSLTQPKLNDADQSDRVSQVFWNASKLEHLTLVNPDASAKLAGLTEVSDDKLLDTFLKTMWGKESFDIHIWMLKKFITCKSEELEHYVISTSYRKMLSRMNHPISQHYLDCLLSLDHKKIRFYSYREWEKKHGRNDDELIRVIPLISRCHKTLEIPNLLKAVEEAGKAKAANGGEVLGIYNNDTCGEFHLLLCDLLRPFHRCLKNLKAFQDEVQPKGTDPPESLTDEQLEELKTQLATLKYLGNSLRAIVKSEAHFKHLVTIDSELSRKQYTGNPGTDKDDEDEEDEELRRLDPPGALPKYGDWANLMVGYANAMRVIRRYVGSLRDASFGNVSIVILASPCSEKRMLPWQTLLRTKEYFPDVENRTIMDEFIEFLTSDVLDDETATVSEDSKPVKRGTIENFARSIKDFEDAVKLDNKEWDYLTAVDSLILDTRHLKDCASPGWLQFIDRILEQLEELKTAPGKEAKLYQIDVIAKILKTFREHSLLFQKLKSGTPLSTGNGFSGSRHCETSLASLISTPLDQILDSNIVDQNVLETLAATGPMTGMMIGMSKRRCPVCAHLLRILKTRDGKPFIVSGGEHFQITPCTLPPGLPKTIIKEIVLEFAGRLRTELVRHLHTNKTVPRRVRSIDWDPEEGDQGCSSQ